MTCGIDNTWLDERIAATKAAIIAVEGAIVALSGGALSYTLDTGQTRQTVTKSEMSSLRLMLNELENRLAVLYARKCGATTRVVPSW